MRLELGRRLVRATVKPHEHSLGHVLHRKTGLDVDWLDPLDWRVSRWVQTEVMVSLAGPEAERRLTGRRNNAGAAADDDWVLDVTTRAEGYGDRRAAHVGWLTLKVRDHVATPLFWARVEAVPGALLDRETLSGAEVRRVCFEAVRDAVPVFETAPRIARRTDGGQKPGFRPSETPNEEPSK
jgi:hypothetical protein